MSTYNETYGNSDFETMLDAAEKLRKPLHRVSGSISIDKADALRGQVGILLSALGEYAADGLAGGYRATDPVWQNLQKEALFLYDLLGTTHA